MTPPVADYIGLGFEHILSGYDHLLFLLALLLIVSGKMGLLKTITTFTLAHSITLALLLFNVGIELGQLLFVFSVLVLLNLVKRLLVSDLSQWAYVPAYGIGVIGVFWLLQRAAGILV